MFHAVRSHGIGIGYRNRTIAVIRTTHSRQRGITQAVLPPVIFKEAQVAYEL